MHSFAGLFLAATLAVSAIAHAAEQPAAGYPSRAVRIILPLSAGGSADAITRLVGYIFANAFAQPVVVDSRPGQERTLNEAAPDGT